MGNSSSSESSSYGMVVRDADSPFAPPRGVFRRKGKEGEVHLVRSTDGVAGETRRSVSRYDVTLARPSIGGQPGTFTRTGSFLVNPHLLRLRFNEERVTGSTNDLNLGGRGSPASSSRNSFVSMSSFGGDEERVNNPSAKTESSKNNNNNNNNDNINDNNSPSASNAGCPRCAERRTKTLASSSSSSRPAKRRRDSLENVAKDRRLSARNALFDSGRG